MLELQTSTIMALLAFITQGQTETEVEPQTLFLRAKPPSAAAQTHPFSFWQPSTKRTITFCKTPFTRLHLNRLTASDLFAQFKRGSAKKSGACRSS